MKADGNCLFHSLAIFCGLSHGEIRKLCVDFTAANLDVVMDITGETFKSAINQEYDVGSTQEYLDEMKRYGVWGGWVEICAFAQMFKKQIEVYFITEGREIDKYQCTDIGVEAAPPVVRILSNRVDHFYGGLVEINRG